MSQRTVGTLRAFVDAWAPAFVSSVAMFSGATLVPDAAPTSEPADPLIWVEQAIACNGPGKVWVGVGRAAGLVLAGAADGDDAGLALVREILDQSVQSAAQVLNVGACPGFACVGAAVAAAPPATGTALALLSFTSAGGSVTCVIRGDAGLEAGLSADVPRPAAGQAADGAAECPATSDPRVFDRFAGVELPVSVVLGRATLKIRDVLKLAVGSLVELDTRTTDPVDVCVHDGVVARGEVVSIRGNYGIRILEVTSQRDRLQLQMRGRHASVAGDGGARQARVH